MTTICIGHAPVLTLWASIVAERLGWRHDTALTLGQAVSAATAEENVDRPRTSALSDRGNTLPLSPPMESTGATREVLLLGQIVRVVSTPRGARALGKNALLEPEAVERYLRAEFGSRLCAALSAMERLADTVATDALDDDALRLYQEFRPEAISAEHGRVGKGVFDLDRVHALARAKRRQD